MNIRKLKEKIIEMEHQTISMEKKWAFQDVLRLIKTMEMDEYKTLENELIYSLRKRGSLKKSK